MSIDIGIYNKHQEEFRQLTESIYERYSEGVTLPPEYAYFLDQNILRLHIRLARYKFVARLLKPTDRVLEIGCGSGLGAMFLSQHCKQVDGIDIKTTEIEESKMMRPKSNVNLRVTNLFDMPSTKDYDVVIALDVIEHFEETVAKEFLQAFKGQLSPTGMGIIGTPSIYSYPHQSAFSRASHVKCYDQAELDAILSQHFRRTVCLGMNDEVIHTGHPKMTWYYFFLGFCPS